MCMCHMLVQCAPLTLRLDCGIVPAMGVLFSLGAAGYQNWNFFNNPGTNEPLLHVPVSNTKY